MPLRSQFETEKEWLDHLLLWFAGMALQGMLSGVESDYMAMQATLNDCERRGLTIQGYFAARAYTAADAMLKRRVADD